MNNFCKIQFECGAGPYKKKCYYYEKESCDTHWSDWGCDNVGARINRMEEEIKYLERFKKEVIE